MYLPLAEQDKPRTISGSTLLMVQAPKLWLNIRLKRYVPTDPKTDIVITVRGVIIVTVGYTAVVIIVVPRTAAQNPRTGNKLALTLFLFVFNALQIYPFFSKIFPLCGILLKKKGKRVKVLKFNRSDRPENRKCYYGQRGHQCHGGLHGSCYHSCPKNRRAKPENCLKKHLLDL